MEKLLDMKKEHTKKCKSSDLLWQSEEFCDCDGYHTWDELYEHRIILWKALLSYQEDLNDEFGTNEKNRVWKSKLHFDGTMFDGWFISGIGIEKGEQITYHLPIN